VLQSPSSLLCFLTLDDVFVSNITILVVSYFIPEDGDSEEQPNVFLAPKPRQQGYPPSLGEVKHSFPLPGKYHFRFKSPLVPGTDREKGAMPVWMDCVDDRQPVPAWRGAIVAKITRIAVEDDDEDDDDDEDFHRPQAAPAPIPHHVAPVPRAPAPQPAPPQQQSQPPAQQQHHAPIDLFGGPSPAPSGNLFENHHTPPVSAQQHHEDLLGGMGVVHHHSQSSADSSDLLGMASHPGGMASHTPPVSGNAYGYNHQQQPPQQQSGPFF
jgi:hypothetical protein